MSEVTSLIPRIKEWDKIRPTIEHDTEIKGLPITVYTEVRSNEIVQCKTTSKTTMPDLIKFSKILFVGRMSIEFHGRMANIHFHTTNGTVFIIAPRAAIIQLADELRGA